MTDLYYVIGNPIEHSLSPEIHRTFAQETGVEISYGKLLFSIGGFANELALLRKNPNVCGANVTVPFKIDAKEASTQLTERAARAGAVNTLKFLGEEILGDNTDGAGFVRDCEERLGVNLVGARVLLLGAGGASRGILAGLMACGCVDVAVANRTIEKAQSLVEFFSDELPVRAITYEATEEASWNVVINATSASISKINLPVAPAAYRNAQLCYDLFYSRTPTTFMNDARRGGAEVVADGLGMLVEQAAESFFLWNGIRPRTDSVYRALRAR